MFGVGCQCWLDVAAWMLLVLDVGDGWILVLDAMAGLWYWICWCWMLVL